jgi:hypothetical protein
MRRFLRFDEERYGVRSRADGEREDGAGCHQRGRDPERLVHAADEGVADGVDQGLGVGAVGGVDAGDRAVACGSCQGGGGGVLKVVGGRWR